MKHQEEIDGMFDRLVEMLRDELPDSGVKAYRSKNECGSIWEKAKSRFRCRLHLIVDADYGQPVAFSVTKASRSEVREGHALMDEMAHRVTACVKSLADALVLQAIRAMTAPR